MVITKDTELYSLVQSDKVISLINDVKLKMHSYIYNRNFTLKLEMANGHLNEKYIVYSKPVYNTMANNVLKGYERVEADAEDLVKEISKAAILKQISELDELITCLNRELEKIRDAISSLQSEYLDNMDKVKNAVIPEEGSTSVYLDRSALSQYGGGAFLQSTYYLSSESDRSSVSNRIHRAYYQTYDPRGIIDLQENFRDKYKAKLDAANKKKQELESQLEKTYYDPTKIYDKDGNVIGSINDQKTTEPIVNPNAIGDLKKGDKVYIDGKEYQVVGYVTLANGEQRAIYVYKPNSLTGSCYAYLDAEGNIQTFEIVRAGKDQSITVDGQKVNMTYLVGDETFTPSNTDKQYVSATANYINGVSGNTLTFNDQEYYYGGPFLGEQVSIDGKTYNVYKNPSILDDTRYYVDENNKIYSDAGGWHEVGIDVINENSILTYNNNQYTATSDTIKTDTGTYTIYHDGSIYDNYIYKDSEGMIHQAGKRVEEIGGEEGFVGFGKSKESYYTKD